MFTYIALEILSFVFLVGLGFFILFWAAEFTWQTIKFIWEVMTDKS